MKTKHLKVVAGMVAGLGLLTASYSWLAFGIFSDREFGTLYIFSKHRLSPRFYFYAPIGESDKPLAALSPRQQRAELAYEEFIDWGGGYARKLRLFP